MKKIIISSYDDLKNPIYGGGGAYAIQQLAKRLAQHYEVTVLSGTYKNASNTINNNIHYKRIGSDILGHKIGQLLYQLALLQYAKKLAYDVWIESSVPPFTFSLLPLFSKKPVISWVHMICSYDMQRKYVINLRPIEKAFCRLYKYIVVPTKWVHDEVKSMNKWALIQTIPNGFDQAKLVDNATETTKEQYLLFIGRIEINQKGLDLLLSALAQTKSTTRVFLAGSGDVKEEAQLQKLIKYYNVEEKIKLIGRVAGEQKAGLFKKATAVIIPSRYETFVTVALESINYQKPVICFAIPQNDWIPDTYATKITPFDTLLLARAIDDSASQKTISAHDKNTFMKQFTWERFTKEMIKFIQQIV